MKEQKENCPKCGEETQELHEGYCKPCINEMTLELHAHNSAHDHWESITSEERNRAIREAI